jgi:UDP-N-acetylglucosamine diphosphorylase / glucose-1-phosphate thymidylyltransferase / UDP-N-acetylgalactosamine diphosphorylase / glucosamine-1-phosphate N-acetyltransferase / galactosamine-1-phosphate N-acetyltransferase
METLWETAVRTVSSSTSDAGGAATSLWVREILAELTREKLGVTVNQSSTGNTLFLNARARWSSLPDIAAVGTETAWAGTTPDGRIACIYAPASFAAKLSPGILLDEARTSAALAGLPRRSIAPHLTLFDWPWELVHANATAIGDDWELRGGADDVDAHIDEGVYLLNRSGIHLGHGSRVKPCVVIDAESGPVWIGNNVRVQPHCYIEGPAFVGDGSLLQPGAVIRGGASVGPVCKVGGEIEGSVLVGFSNKQHDGFLGHSYIGSFVNIAADCINSDLKNTYGTIRVPINGREVETNHQFVGLTVGDHSKAGINVGFPTGAVMGFCSSVVGAECPKFVPSFAWIESGEWLRFDATRGLAVAKRVMARRNLAMSAAEEKAFLAVRTQALALEHASQIRMEN